jgi:putative acetyltransferase
MLSRKVEIIQAKAPGQIEEIRALFREYERFLKVDLCFQDFEKELAGLPGKYGPPDGSLLIAVDGQETAGCVALRKIEEGVCEMKRLFVRPRFRGQGLGRLLAARIIGEAKALGYGIMWLDTLERLTEAMNLYESLGFEKRDSYYDNPLPGVVYWELDLSGRTD